MPIEALQEVDITCPYCGESFSLVFDCSVAEQSNIEDCQVCCQPIVVEALVGDNDRVLVTVSRENE